VDIKVVTVNNKVWATFVGKGNYALAGNGWSSQVQLYTGAAKSNELSSGSGEGNYIMVDRDAKTMTVTAYPIGAQKDPVETGFNGFRPLQEDNNQFGWTDIIPYNQAAPSSGLDGDTEAPVLVSAEAGEQAGASLPITCVASDDSGDYFYLVTDEANNYGYASFTDVFTIGGLKPATSYTLRVVAVDFSGNESEPVIIQIGEKPFESVLAGVARDLKFELGSTESELQVRVSPVAAENTLSNFKIQLGLENTTFTEDDPYPYHPIENDWAGQASLVFSIKSDQIFRSAPEGIVYLNFTYLLGPVVEPVSAEDWANVFANTRIVSALSEGPRTGERIAIKMGDGEVIPTGIPSVESAAIGLLHAGNQWTVCSPEAIRSVEVYSVGGQKVFTGSSASVPTDRLSKGIYLLKATDVKGTAKVMKAIVK
jgi:hypothetical protein